MKIFFIILISLLSLSGFSQDYFGSHSHLRPAVDFAYSDEGYYPYDITSSSISVGVHIYKETGAYTTLGIRYGTEYPFTGTNSTTVTLGTYWADRYYTMSGLQPSTLYYIGIWGNNYLGEYLSVVGVYTLGTANAPPAVSTASITSITGSTASSGGNVTDQGGASVTDRGVCWSIYQSPTTSQPSTPTASGGKTSDGTGSGSFTSSLTALAGGTTYYVRAYATNIYGTSYGNQYSFTTVSLPYLRILSLTIQVYDGTVTYDITDNGTTSLSSSGFCWSTSNNPTTSDNCVYGGTSFTSYTVSLTALSASTTYYGRAFAINSIGTGYSSEVAFNTRSVESITTPTVNTSVPSSILASTATGGGNVVLDGGASVTNRGVCWSTSINPTISQPSAPTVTGGKTSDGTGTGSFTSSLTGMAGSTQYYVRAFATNNQGTSYGVNEIFTTTASLAVSTESISAITQTTATGGGNVTNDGGLTVTARGIVAKIGSTPTIASYDKITSNGTGTGIYASSLTGLTMFSTYKVRAYATNSTGTSYGEEIEFTTDQRGAPIVTTTAISGITSTAAYSGGVIISDGGLSIIEKGVCWYIGSTPFYDDDHTSDGTGSASYSSIISGLTTGTNYHVRAYAINSDGMSEWFGYGEELEFTTSYPNPTVVTNSYIDPYSGTTEMYSNNVRMYGTITSPYYSVIERGFVFSTSANPTIADIKVTSGSGAGTYNQTIGTETLTYQTTYYVRAYATTSEGTYYGNSFDFTTEIAATIPYAVSSTVVSLSFIYTSYPYLMTGGGILWDTQNTPTLTNYLGINTDLNSFLTGKYTFSGGGLNITGLTTGTTYYFRPYVTNSQGIKYGKILSITTP